MLSAEVRSQLDRHASEGTDTKSDAEFRGCARGGARRPLPDRGHRIGANVFGPQGVGRVVPGPGSARRLRLDRGRRSPAQRADQEAPVIDYKLADVPDLGYFSTDRPHPRGELLLKTVNMFPGYYRRPEVTAEVFDEEGFYRTGDVVAELGPDRLQYVDRRNFVLKLSQGEFVTASKLEAVFETSPLVRQIYIYGNSARPYLLAVIVPTPEALSQHDTSELRVLISESLADVAKEADLQSFEVPRDFILETTAFTLENGLLTGIRKLARPKLKEIYGPQLEELYEDLTQGQAAELRELRQGGATRPVIETVTRAAAALLGSAASDLSPDAHFTDLGGDSLSALTFANLLREIFFVEVPVGVIVSPANDLAALAEYIETERSGSTVRRSRPSTGAEPTRSTPAI